MKYSRKSQLEIMGLVVIVVLISLGLLFVLQFTVLRGDDSDKGAFTQEQLARGTLNAMLDTSTDCQMVMRNLIRECAGGLNQVTCKGVAKEACGEVERVAFIMLNGTLGGFNKQYNFEVVSLTNQQGQTGTRRAFVPGGDCFGSKDVFTQPLPPPAGGGSRSLVRLEVC